MPYPLICASNTEFEGESSSIRALTFHKPSLHRRRNLTLVSNVCKVVLKSLFWALNGLKELPEMSFKFPFNLIGKSTMAFLTGQSWHVLKSWYTGGGVEQGFQHCFADGLNWSLISSVAHKATKILALFE